ncbi:MAG: bifunctional phosphopantothenoylcysteine decarboxylase/phosphopantothenate--cysteine ligase CoaBC [Clostridiales bacterium]|jgi:phosphopantothenoylcysteine decarboxylase/phosphopantothenate--cysteine ligase|nr:bifunctional phosphopantothenoylcysteine decarboxylase/phosphopantothenate--cysteine ligase CoaBC [Clostridiales bacterium]
MLSGKTVAVGVTGGIAAYKTCEIVGLLKKAGAEVFVVMTAAAREFVTPLTFETLSNNRVITDMFDRDFNYEVEHVSLAKKADLFLIAPATANFVGKAANGIADDFLTTTVMAAGCPVVIAPAMNTAMLKSAAYRANEDILRARGVHIIEPGTGRLACGDEGAGRLADPQKIVGFVISVLCPVRDYAGKTFLITAGATAEPIDPARCITNYSSGKMGFCLAAEAKSRGASVILIAGQTSVLPPKGCTLVRVRTADEMYNAVLDNLKVADYIVKAAAVSDYRPAGVAENKIKSDTLTLKLVKNKDIAKAVGEKKGKKKLVVFAAETENLIANAQKKLISKNADMVVANDVTKDGAGFNSDTNIAALITDGGVLELPLMDKRALAARILDKLAEL